MRECQVARLILRVLLWGLLLGESCENGEKRVVSEHTCIQTKASSLNTGKSQLANLKGGSGMEDRKRGRTN